ncbi:MAG: hypothetical protein WC121_12050 [Candidatus Kapaibacterium sp.]|jgi:predicted HicB family RNase H-like nuclease
MKETIKYKKYIGSVDFSQEDNLYYGKIQGIKDLVTYEGKSISELNIAFKEAVEDYEELCELITEE